MFDAFSSSIADNPLQALLSAIIVVGGLFIYGFRDTLRFSIKRAWAISDVCFAESIRRKVLWITPLAMLGVVFVSQLQKPIDEQDAIRQTIKFIIFASGMVVTLAILILTCTNLPKDIETRVIFTVVTKPTTRLEIIVGKVIGFAKVSATILGLMGVFALIYLNAQAWSLERDLRYRLDHGQADPLSRATYEYWASQGLLTSRTFKNPERLQIFAEMPSYDSTTRWFRGGSGGVFIVPFQLDPSQLTTPGPRDSLIAKPLRLQLHVGYRSAEFGAPKPEGNIGYSVGVLAPSPSDDTIVRRPPPGEATVVVEFDDANLNPVISPSASDKELVVPLMDPTGRFAVQVDLSADTVVNLAQNPFFYVRVLGATPRVEYSVDVRSDPDPLNNSVCFVLPDNPPMGSVRDAQGNFTPPSFRGYGALYGQQLLGGPVGKMPIAIYPFRNSVPATSDKDVAFEIRAGIERAGDGDESDATTFEVTIVDSVSHQVTAGPISIHPENNRTTYFSVPASAVHSGNFDFCVRNVSKGQFAALRDSASLAMVISQESFSVNLFKSLSILWMLSILVVIIALFCSTFLSWPIAVVLTLILLLGHWAVIKLSDVLAPGIGNQVATDIFGSAAGQASKARVVSSTVEALSKGLLDFGSVLPDIGQFSAIDEIERGATIPVANLIAPMSVLLLFGLPLLVLSYVLLRNKEVAP